MPAHHRIKKLLIANRGEIARRIIRTAHDMGIATVAVYADGDAGAPFVAEAGSAYALGGRSSAETVFRYEISPTAAGRFRIGPIRVGVGSQLYESPALELAVTAVYTTTGGAITVETILPRRL